MECLYNVNKLTYTSYPNMLKRVTLLIVIALLCTLLALWSPWIYWNLDPRALFGVVKPNAISGLQIFSLSGEINIMLDSKDIGSVNLEKSPFFLDTVTPGEHLVTLIRKDEISSEYWSFSKLIRFEEGTSVVVSYFLGPTEEFSEGHFIYAVKKSDPTLPSKLNVKLNTPDADIQIESISVQKFTGETFATDITLEAQKKIRISKSGFEPLEFTILPESQEERDKLKDFDFFVEAHLMFLPIEVE
jgi:hypothetical protein